MNFDQMIEAWRTQDEVPLYGVNRQLLGLVVQRERDDLRRQLRLEHWTNIIVGTAMAALAGGVLWWFLHFRGGGGEAIVATLGIGAFVVWVAALWLSLRRQERREREFGNSLQEEVRRNLSLVDYQLSRVGRWSTLMLWSAPILVGSSLTYWLIAEINDNTGFWFDVGVIVFIVVSIATTTYETSRKSTKDLEPRRQRLTELLEMLERP
jgi:hypothetical protein